jgi:hypothetical protein
MRRLIREEGDSILPKHEHFQRLHSHSSCRTLRFVQICWTYTPSPVDRSAAEMWITANDCSVVDMIAIGEHSLATSATQLEGMRQPAVTVKRHLDDLSNDLAIAVIGLRLSLPPTPLQRFTTS